MRILITLIATAIFAFGEYVVAFAQDTMSNDWRVAQVKALQKAFAKYPEVKFVYSVAGGKTAKQIMDIEEHIRAKVDVLITSPRDSKAMIPVVKKAYYSGIPVILISRSIDSDDYTSYIHPDNTRIAKKAANYIAKRLNNKGNVLILQHIPTTTPGRLRTEGFLQEIKKYKDINIVGIKVANSKRAEAITQTTNAIKEGLKFDAIYAQSDSMATGAIMALKKHGIDPKSIVITGIDYISEAREYIKSGELDASYVYPTGGKEGAKVTMGYLHGKSVPKEYIIDSIEVTKDNVDKVEPIF
jgi:ribose transport system substrate-binding protein